MFQTGGTTSFIVRLLQLDIFRLTISISRLEVYVVIELKIRADIKEKWYSFVHDFIYSRSMINPGTLPLAARDKLSKLHTSPIFHWSSILISPLPTTNSSSQVSPIPPSKSPILPDPLLDLPRPHHPTLLPRPISRQNPLSSTLQQRYILYLCRFLCRGWRSDSLYRSVHECAFECLFYF